MTVSDYTIAAARIAVFFVSLGKKGLNGSKKVSKIVFKTSGRALEIGAKNSTAFASWSSKVLSRLPDVINFYHSGKG